jgi:hypothetical protein
MKPDLVPTSHLKNVSHEQEHFIYIFISIVKLIHETTVVSVHIPPYLTYKNPSTFHAVSLFHIILKTSSHVVVYVNRIHLSIFVTGLGTQFANLIYV